MGSGRSALGGVLTSFPYAAFAESIGLMRLTKIMSLPRPALLWL
ncbi:solute carrier family 23 protein [Streptomyces sp. NBC_01264]|nr:solute carrier family 23 protein [Streptomyces sp. NBC_01264]MCX4775963.1 hypothetical protein [Streptomyces sp. NBC_01264]